MPWNFANELARYGPHTTPQRVSFSDARAYCARVTRSRPENFAVASLLLPRRLVPHYHAVYAYCRWADDLADETADAQQALALLKWWGDLLRQAYAGHASHPVMIALADTAKRFQIPQQLFLDLLVAFEQDQVKKRYGTFAELLGYCRYSANPVGRIVLQLYGCYDDHRAELADATCTGLQLANFWQDVRPDWELGRVYLPQEDCDRFGYNDIDFEANRFTPEFRELLAFQVRRTANYFDFGEQLVPLVPKELQADLVLFTAGGRELLAAIERQNFDVWQARPKVGKLRRAKLLAEAAVKQWFG